MDGKKRSWLLVGVVCVALLAWTGTSQAALITLTNAGFEANSVPDGDGTHQLDGWSIYGSGDPNAGTQNPSVAQIPSEAHGGVNAAYANDPIEYGGPMAVRQTTAATWQANTVYTLTVYIARRMDLPPEGSSTGQAEFQLRDADDDAAVTIDTYDLSGNGAWNLYTLQYTTSDSDACLGHLIAVQFRTVSGTQLSYDDISLDATAVPEPATMSLLLFGGGLALARRRMKS
jgi:hypothetical protein